MCLLGLSLSISFLKVQISVLMLSVFGWHLLLCYHQIELIRLVIYLLNHKVHELDYKLIQLDADSHVNISFTLALLICNLF